MNSIYDWQTLIAGAFALIGAFLLWLQIRSQRSKDRQEAERRALAARIQLPHALHDIHLYLDSCYSAWRSANAGVRPQPPFEALATLMDAATNVDRTTFHSIIALIQKMQVFEARASTQPNEQPTNYYDQMFTDLLELYYLSNRLFDFGRLSVDTVPMKEPERSDLEQVTSRDLDFYARTPTDSIVERGRRALDLRFGRNPQATDNVEEDE